MLSNQTQIFYYANRSIIITWFDFEINMKNFFEKFEWHCMNLIKWQIVNLINIISLNLILSTVECFRKLVIKMNILQRNIDFQFDDQFHFRKNIIRIVRDHSAFLIKFINSTNDVINFVSNLQNSIINYETMHKLSTHEIYVQFYKNNEKKMKLKIKHITSIVIIKKKSKMRNRNHFFRLRNTNQYKSFKSNSLRQKKCFVCEKIDSWFINHTFQKKNDSIKKFENKYFQLRIKSNFNKNTQHWIIEYKNENIDKIIQFFNQLIIDFETYNTKSDWLENTESNNQFYILYEVLEDFESSITIKQFVNNSLLHRINKCDEIISLFLFTLYIYNVIFESRYESTEFKNIFIDTNVSIKSNAKFD